MKQQLQNHLLSGIMFQKCFHVAPHLILPKGWEAGTILLILIQKVK